MFAFIQKVQNDLSCLLSKKQNLFKLLMLTAIFLAFDLFWGHLSFPVIFIYLIGYSLVQGYIIHYWHNLINNDQPALPDFKSYIFRFVRQGFKFNFVSLIIFLIYELIVFSLLGLSIFIAFKATIALPKGFNYLLDALPGFFTFSLLAFYSLILPLVALIYSINFDSKDLSKFLHIFRMLLQVKNEFFLCALLSIIINLVIVFISLTVYYSVKSLLIKDLLFSLISVAIFVVIPLINANLFTKLYKYCKLKLNKLNA